MLETIPAIFDQTVARFGGKTALTYKKNDSWHPITYREFADRAERVTAALIGLGVVKGDRVALLSENRPEWVISDQGILAAGAVNVPIYPTLTPAQIKYILNDCGAKVAIVSSNVHLAKIAEIQDDLGQLTHVVLLDGEPTSKLQQELLDWDAFIHKGEELLEATANERKARKDQLGRDDLASIIYTSGTTGNPKGAMLTHGNLSSNCQTVVKLISISDADSCLSFLPLCHVFERIAYYAFVVAGAKINYAENIDKVPQNLTEVHPTFLCSVPRLFEKIRARVYEAMESAGGLKKKLFHWALDVARKARLEREKVGSVPPILAMQVALGDKLVFSKIRERTGGQLRFAISGGAPLSKEVAEFFTLIGITLLEGYGMTETSPVIACNVPGAIRLGTVGRPIPGVEVKIADDGEILCKGPNVMKGYWNNPEATAEAIDSEGYMHTGDIGTLDAEGFLKITDRKKEILVMSNGKNVAPAPIENALITSPYIAQALLIGDNRNFISALVVPNFESLERWARTEGLQTASREALARHDKVKQLLRAEIDRTTRDFARFEQIKEFVVLPEEFSQEKGHLTPTLKYKRRVIHEQFRDQIEAIYASTPPQPVGA